MPTLIIDSLYFEKSLKHLQEFRRFLKEEKLSDEDLNNDETLARILRDGLHHPGVHPKLSKSSIKTYISEFGGIETFLDTPLYLLNGTLAMAIYNNRIQHQIQGNYTKPTLNRARHLYCNLHDGKHNDDEGVAAYRAICSLTDYPIAQRIQSNDDFNLPEEEHHKIIKFLQQRVEDKKMRLRERHNRIEHRIEERTRPRYSPSPVCRVHQKTTKSAPLQPKRNTLQNTDTRYIHRQRIRGGLKMLRIMKHLKLRQHKLTEAQNDVATKSRLLEKKIRKFETAKEKLTEREKTLAKKLKIMAAKNKKINEREKKLREKEQELAAKIALTSQESMDYNTEQNHRSSSSSRSLLSMLSLTPSFSKLTNDRSLSSASMTLLSPNSVSLRRQTPSSRSTLPPDDLSPSNLLPSTSQAANISPPRNNPSPPSKPIPLMPLSLIALNASPKKDRRARSLTPPQATALTMAKCINRKKWSDSYKIGDIVFVKHRHHPFWPAVVRDVKSTPRPAVTICWFPVEQGGTVVVKNKDDIIPRNHANVLAELRKVQDNGKLQKHAEYLAIALRSAKLL